MYIDKSNSINNATADTFLKIIKSVIYIRVSTEEQARHGYSLQAQRERLEEYCRQHNYKIIDYYMDEGKSARSKMNSRKELLRLIEDAKLKKFDRVVFWRLDRWFRNVKDYYKIQDILEKHNIDWECSDEEYNTTTSNGRLHLNIKLSIAQNESDQTSDRIKFNFDNMIKNKRAIQGSHCMPLGYKVAGEEKNKHIVKDEETKEIVEDMFDYFYQYQSIRKTTKYINDKYSLQIRTRNITGYLKNKLYTGEYKNVQNYCEAYITKDKFNEIQEKIKRNIKQSKNRYDYIFSGLIKCPKCGNSMAGSSYEKKNAKYHYYRCSLAKNSQLCNYNCSINEKILEAYLLKNIESELKKVFIETSKMEEKEKHKKKNTKSLEDRLERLNDLYIDGKINKEKYDNEETKIKSEIVEIKKYIEKKRDLTIYNKLLSCNLLDIYNRLNNISKRAFWGKCINYVSKNNEERFIIHFK